MILDCTHIATAPSNDTLEYLCKSAEDGVLWHPHPTDRLLSAMEEASTTWVIQALQGVHVLAMHAFGLGGAKSLLAVLAKAKPEDLDVKCRALEKKMAAHEPGSLSMDDYLNVIDCWLYRYLPPALATQKAKRTAIQQYLSGFARHDERPTTNEQAVAVIDKLPATVSLAAEQFGLGALDRARVHVAEATAARHLANITHATRSAIQGVIIQAEKRRIGAGTTRYAGQPLEQELNDKFALLNQDWRRVAVTETAINATDAYLSRLKPGERVRWLAHPGACRYCESQNGKIFTLVPADHPRKDPETQMWVGKSAENIGRSISAKKRTESGELVDRSAEERIIPAIPAHPHCRCLPVALVAPIQGGGG